jgi:hypothetical protein
MLCVRHSLLSRFDFVQSYPLAQLHLGHRLVPAIPARTINEQSLKHLAAETRRRRTQRYDRAANLRGSPRD